MKKEEKEMSRITFSNSAEELTKILNELGINSKTKDEEENKCVLFMGRKRFEVTFGMNFIRISRGDKKVQLAYTSKKNVAEKIVQRLEVVKAA